jgi:O-antigen ligase
MKIFACSFKLPKNATHFLVMWSLLFALLLDIGVAYRSLAYMNIVLVIYQSIKLDSFKNKLSSRLAFLLMCPVTFLILHYAATARLNFSDELNQFILIVFTAVGLYIVADKDEDFIKSNYQTWLSLLTFCFLATQLVSILLFKHLWGTCNNSHYLAINCALLMPLVILLIMRSANQLHVSFLAASLVLLTSLVIYTASRPTWIGLILASIYVIFFINQRYKLSALALLIGLLTLLFLTNLGDFGSKFKELAVHISTEERNVIWHDAWTMQKTSDIKQWLVGHGLNSYENDFMSFSSYHAKNIDFGSPHNWLLEILYISGVIGLIVFLSAYIYTWRQLMLTMKYSAEYKTVALMLFAMLITSIVMGFLTVKVFSHYTIFQLAFVVGIALWLRDSIFKTSIK